MSGQSAKATASPSPNRDDNDAVANAPSSSPSSVSQAVSLLRHIDDGKLLVKLPINSEAISKVNVPDGVFLHVDAAYSKNTIDPENTSVGFVDEDGEKIRLKLFWLLVTLERFWLQAQKNSTQESDTNVRSDVVAGGWILSCIPFRKQILTDIPLCPSGILEKLSSVAKPPKVSTTATSTKLFGSYLSAFDVTEIQYEITFKLRPGAKVDLNDGTSVVVDSDDGHAAFHIQGSGDICFASVKATNVRLITSMLSTGPSDIDARITISRKSGGVHHIALNESVLRNVQFKVSDMTPPEIGALRIDANDYDFVITINPNDELDFEALMNVIKRFFNPEIFVQLKKKLSDGAKDPQGKATAPLEVEISTAQWNILDYITHGFKEEFQHVLSLPNISIHLNDPAIKKLCREGVRHLYDFLFSTWLRRASIYNLEKLSGLVKDVLTRHADNRLPSTCSDAVASIKRALKIADSENLPRETNRNLKDTEDAAAPYLKSISASAEVAALVSSQIVSIGVLLSIEERKWLRETWVEAGGMEADGRAYALIVNLYSAIFDAVESDEDAPLSLKEFLKQLPTEHDLKALIATNATELRGSVWAANGVLKNGWKAVSEHLESTVERLYDGNTWGQGFAVFREQAITCSTDCFVDGGVRFIGNGKEFFAQIMKLLEDTERVFSSPSSFTKCAIVLNYWSFKAFTDSKTGKSNYWGVKLADRLKDLAMNGFTVSVVVDERNSTSRTGQQYLLEIAEDVREASRGRFNVTLWRPSKDKFALGTHVKYFCTPLGVIAGGSNIGDLYEHWSDSNIMLRGESIVETFFGLHSTILEEQRDIGHKIVPVPAQAPVDPNEWKPLMSYRGRGEEQEQEEQEVFNPSWQTAGIRVFRDQGGDADDRILVELIAFLNSARGFPVDGETSSLPPQTVYIANCYIVLTQPLEEHPLARAFQRALERGVNIELLTNSKDSIDVEWSAAPMIESVFFMMAYARDLARTAEKEGRRVGRLTVHMPDAEFISKDEHGKPNVLIHDKIAFCGELAFVKTMNMHPRSFTLEQELLTELIGTEQPWHGVEHEEFASRAREFIKRLGNKPGGNRMKDIDDILKPVMWHGDSAPELWGPSAMLYLQFIEKRFLYCHSFTSECDEDVKAVEAKLDESVLGSLLDLFVNVF